jgi:hypothetical protein
MQSAVVKDMGTLYIINHVTLNPVHDKIQVSLH